MLTDTRGELPIFLGVRLFCFKGPMSITTLLNTAKRVQIVAGNTTLEIDATPTISHNRTSTLSKFPIEDGAIVSDHVTLENEKIRLDCIVTEHPIFFPATALSTAISAGVGDSPIVAGVLSSTASTLLRPQTDISPGENDLGRVESAFNYLNDLWRNRIPFVVVSGLNTYDNVIMTNLSINETSKTKNALRFTASFEQIIIAISQTTLVDIKSADELDDSLKKSGASKSDRGTQSTQPVSEDVQTPSSILFKAWRAVRSEN